VRFFLPPLNTFLTDFTVSVAVFPAWRAFVSKNTTPLSTPMRIVIFFLVGEAVTSVSPHLIGSLSLFDEDAPDDPGAPGATTIGIPGTTVGPAVGTEPAGSATGIDAFLANGVRPKAGTEDGGFATETGARGLGAGLGADLGVAGFGAGGGAGAAGGAGGAGGGAGRGAGAAGAGGGVGAAGAAGGAGAAGAAGGAGGAGFLLLLSCLSTRRRCSAIASSLSFKSLFFLFLRVRMDFSVLRIFCASLSSVSPLTPAIALALAATSCGAAAGAAEDFLKGRSSISAAGFTGFTKALFLVPFCVLLPLRFFLVNTFFAFCSSEGLAEGVAETALFP